MNTISGSKYGAFTIKPGGVHNKGIYSAVAFYGKFKYIKILINLQ